MLMSVEETCHWYSRAFSVYQDSMCNTFELVIWDKLCQNNANSHMFYIYISRSRTERGRERERKKLGAKICVIEASKFLHSLLLYVFLALEPIFVHEKDRWKEMKIVECYNRFGVDIVSFHVLQFPRTSW